MAELAAGSGGELFHNSNDLTAGFRDLGAMPEHVYMPELSLDQVKADGTYPRLTVKVAGADFEVRARRGYFAPIQEKVQTNEPLKEPEKEAAMEPSKEEEKAVVRGPEKKAGKESAANDKPDAVVTASRSEPATPSPSPAVDTKRPDKNSSNRNLQWAPPMVDMPLGTGASSQPCVLAEILQQAGKRASELFTSLQSFSAQETLNINLPTTWATFRMPVSEPSITSYCFSKRRKVPTSRRAASPSEEAACSRSLRRMSDCQRWL
jgi:hypothetical protein